MSLAARFDYRCPHCGEIISPTRVSSRQSSAFHCPGCQQWLRVSAGYPKTVWVCCLAISGILFFALGLRNWTLLIVALLASLPFWILSLAIVVLFYPPKLESIQPSHPVEKG